MRAAEIACLDSRVSSLSFLSLSSAACIILRLCHSIRLPAVHHLAARSESNPPPPNVFLPLPQRQMRGAAGAIVRLLVRPVTQLLSSGHSGHSALPVGGWESRQKAVG